MRALMLAAGFLLVPGAVHATEVAEMTVDTIWRVELDAAGHVTAVEQESRARPVLADPLEAAIRGWRFEPGHVDGKPAATETTLYVTAALEPVADGYAVRVKSAHTGVGVNRDETAAPQFPQRVVKSIRTPYAGLGVVKAEYDATGKVHKSEPAADVSESDRVLARSAAHAVKRWTFRPERVAGHGVPGTVYVPVCFQLQRNGEHAVPCPAWTRPGAATAGESSNPVSSDPAAKLGQDVIGKTL
jgi:hypothetical protein